MFSKQLLIAVAVGFLSFAGCVGATNERGSADQGDSLVLTNAHISHDGELFVVTGLTNGVEASVTVSDVSIDGNGIAPTGRAQISASLVDPITCYVCACKGDVCVCKQISCAQ